MTPTAVAWEAAVGSVALVVVVHREVSWAVAEAVEATMGPEERVVVARVEVAMEAVAKGVALMEAVERVVEATEEVVRVGDRSRSSTCYSSSRWDREWQRYVSSCIAQY